MAGGSLRVHRQEGCVFLLRWKAWIGKGSYWILILLGLCHAQSHQFPVPKADLCHRERTLPARAFGVILLLGYSASKLQRHLTNRAGTYRRGEVGLEKLRLQWSISINSIPVVGRYEFRLCKYVRVPMSCLVQIVNAIEAVPVPLSVSRLSANSNCDDGHESYRSIRCKRSANKPRCVNTSLVDIPLRIRSTLSWQTFWASESSRTEDGSSVVDCVLRS